MSLSDKSVYIVSAIGTQSELLAYYLREQTKADCICDKNLEDIVAVLEPERCDDAIILLDCIKKQVKDQLIEVQAIDPAIVSKCHLCLFNVQHDGPGMAEAVSFGVRGVFYENDPLERIQKGLRCIFRGQYWIARSIMEKCISMMHTNNSKPHKIEPTTDILTRREKEILSSLATGYSNEEIAKKLFISQHTVKTHVFNVYKKINVSNRLQASLWAAKNL